MAIPHGNVTLHRNASAEISGITYKCAAKSKDDALRQLSTLVLPLLDYTSFLRDVPLFVQAIAWKDQRNEVTGSTYISPFIPTELAPDGQLSKILHPAYALYREALGSTSPFYAYLCLVKILEGIFGRLRHRLYKAAGQACIQITQTDETVPPHEKLGPASAVFVGKSIQHVYESVLKPAFRVAIAHFAEDDKDPIVVSDYLQSGAVTRHLFLLRLCCRRMIDAYEGYFRQLAAAGAAF